MAVPNSGFSSWSVRLQQASESSRREALWLASETGPLSQPARLAISDLWGGPFAEQLRGVLLHLHRLLGPWAEHLSRLHGALDRASREAVMAVEATGGAPSFDVLAALAPWRVWPLVSPPLAPGWPAAGARDSAAFVYVFPDRGRQLVSALRRDALELRAGRRRLADALAPVGIDQPPFYDPMASAAEEVAGEVLRRIEALEEADRRTAGTLATVGEQLGFPGSLAPPADLDRDELAEPARRRQRAAVGPGHQPTQGKEADPVSTSTGNYCYHAVDLAQPSRGVPTVLARTYNSLRAAIDGTLGFGWSHGLGVRLVADGQGFGILWDDGHEDFHRRDGTTLVPPPGVFDRLQALEVGWELAAHAKVRYRFDADGRLVGVADRSGNLATLEYDSAGHPVLLTDASGAKTALEHDEAGHLTAVAGVLDRRWAYGYSVAGDLVTATDPEGATTTFDYDGGHRLVAITDPEGHLVVRNIYDPEGRVVEQKDGAGGLWTYAYEPGRTTVTDPLGCIKTFEFDGHHRTTAVTDANGGLTRFAWDDASNLLAVTDATERTFRFSYGPRGSLTSAEGPDSGQVSVEWDGDDNITAVCSSDGHRATFAWDGCSRPLELTSAAGMTTTITWTPDGRPSAVVAGDGGATRYGFDERGHLASVTDPLGAVTSVEFDAAGRPVAEAHPGGHRTIFTWDRADRLTAVTDAAGGTTTYAYDGCGRLVSFTDPLGRTTAYRYEGRGLLATVMDPLGRETTFTYDACGRLAARADPRGVTVTFSYDPAGRLIGIQAPDLAPVRYGWDPAGRLVAMTDETGTTTWELDGGGRPLIERRPGDVSLVHLYDGLGRRHRLELRRCEATLGTWEYRFDADGRVVSVVDPTGGETLLGYDGVGRLVSTRHPNGTVWTSDIDLAGQPACVAVTGSGGEVLAEWRNTFDDDGNLVCCDYLVGEISGGVETTTFAYDDLGRLLAAERPGGSARYAWDAASNRTAATEADTSVAHAYDAADQVTAGGSDGWRYDAAGNLVERPGAEAATLVYDAVGRVAEAGVDGRTASFSYDGLGRRVIRRDGETAVTRVYDSATVVAELSGNGSVVLETAAGLLVLHRTTATGIRYLHPDANTNVALVSNEVGSVVARWQYAPFGSRTGEGEVGASGPLGFGGALGVREEVGGLLDMRARFYDPTLGRFTSPDPWPAYLPEPITLNRYQYALGDPISQVDPYGLFCLTGKNDKGKCRGLKDVADRMA
ncbi:MAG: RHS repeat-associated core domain-containing protein, partial [Gaiellales bacterium]